MKKFEELNRKITKLDNKFDSLQETMPAQINKVVDDRFKNNLFTIIKWVVVTVGGAVAIAVGGPLCNGNDFLGVNMKETAIVLVIEIVVVALSLTAYKKQLKKTAGRAEIIWLAIILSTILTISLGFGIPFVGMPFAVVAYIITVFFFNGS